MRVGAIDIGSNSIRLLVAEGGAARGAALETVSRAGEACRLGRGLHATGLIDPDVAERAATVVAEFARRARSMGARHIVVAATAALRSARNGEEVAARLSQAAGVRVRILSGEEEAQIVYESVATGLGGVVANSQCVVFDLGGGSTEVVSGVGWRAGRWTSLPFGAVSLTERLLAGDPPGPDAIQKAREWIRDGLMHGCAGFPARTNVLAGVGGTVTVLASMDRGMTEYDPALLEGWVVDRTRALQLVEQLTAASPEERMKLPVMGEGRADIIVAGALVVEALLDRFGAPGLVCSTQGLRYGLARLALQEAVAGSTRPETR